MESKYAAKRPTNTQDKHNKELSDPNFNSADSEKPCPKSSLIEITKLWKSDNLSRLSVSFT